MGDWRDRLRRVIAIKKAEKGLKITELSKELGWGRDGITRMLRVTSNPSLERVKILCDALDVSFVEIYTGVRDHAVYDEVVGQVSQLTDQQLRSLRDHLRQAPVYSEVPSKEPKKP